MNCDIAAYILGSWAIISIALQVITVVSQRHELKLLRSNAELKIGKAIERLNPTKEL